MNLAYRFAPWVLTLTVIWVLLNGELSVGNVLGGLAVSILVLAVFPLARPTATHRLHPWAAFRFLVYLAWNLVTSSVQVILAVVAPTPERLRSGIVRVELPGATPLVTTLVANSITLTPGTLTVTAESDPAVLHIHVLGLGDLDEFRASIRQRQDRLMAAMTPREGVAP